MSDDLLVIENLRVSIRRGKDVLLPVRDVSLTVPRAGTRIVLGESGSGKSVTLRAVLGLAGQSARLAGRIRFAGQELIGLPGDRYRALRGKQLGFVPQSPHDAFDPSRPVGAQIAEIMRVHGVCGARSARAEARDMLGLAGIANPDVAAAAYPHELSGGMAQRAAIALAISTRPALLLADEPTSALDVTVQAGILALLARLRAELGMALLMVTHDVGVAEEVGGEVTVMYAGLVAEDGASADVLAGPRHPYLAGLLGAQPSPDVARGELVAVEGQAPALHRPLAGCAYEPRCPWARADPCRAEVPSLAPAGGSHRSACPVWLAEPALVHGSSHEQ
jgi:oligopeptide/dipeptide ABC transporter ATP-binding protein